jgi:hypothetical protein
MCERLGDHSLAVVETAGVEQPPTVTGLPDDSPEIDQVVGLDFSPKYCLLFADDGIACVRG